MRRDGNGRRERSTQAIQAGRKEEGKARMRCAIFPFIPLLHPLLLKRIGRLPSQKERKEMGNEKDVGRKARI